jgi:hypothetical protein
VAITSKDIAKRDGEKELLAQSIEALCKNFDHKISLETAYTVDAFDLDEVYTTCVQVVREDYPHFDWIFNVTAATKIMSLGAYKAATKLSNMGKSIRCWYIDTLHAKVVPLVGSGRDNQLFAISLEDYATVYNCQMLPGTPGESQRKDCLENWLPFAQFLVKHSHYIDVLKEIIKQISDQKKVPPLKEAKSSMISLAVDGTQEILQEASKVKLLDVLDISDQAMKIKLSYTQYHFLNGQWLEVYVWGEAMSLENGLAGAKLFSDCQWDRRIPDENNHNDDRNQIDAALIYNAQLLIVECKTGDEFFKTETIYKLNSIARSLGDRFVTKLLVTSIRDFTKVPVLDKKTEGVRDKLIDVKTRARNDHIIPVMREDLMNIREILKKQAVNPDYPRL